MSERALLERFDLVAENPENIPLLRRYIVDLAIRGKLLEPTNWGISASEMLKRIGAKADSLVKQGKLKKPKSWAPISLDEIPFTYASHGTFERLGNIANLQKGLTGIQSAIPGNYPLVVTAAARSTCDHYDFDGAAAIVPMVSSTGHGNASLNRLHYQEGKFALGTILCAVFPIDEELISARFLFEYLTAFKDELLVSKMNGTANVTLTVGKIEGVPVPIIAPDVQRRVGELMALCDQLEAAKHEREARRSRLVAASLHRIGTAAVAADKAGSEAPSATLLRDAVRFHLDHLPRLTTSPEHIKQLRQTILNLAVRGRLVQQDPNDEPAEELLKRIQAEKARLVTEGKAGKQDPFEAPPEELTPFQIPKTWLWVPATYPAHLISDLGKKVQTKHVLKTGSFPVVDQGKVFIRGYSNDSDKVIHIESPIVLFGDHTRETKLIDFDFIVGADGVKLLQPICLLATFYHLALTWLPLDNRGYGRHYKLLRAAAIPLPPLAEQHRIVAKVDELMALCDQLEAQLTTTQTDSRRLLEAVLHEALAAAA